MRSLLLEEVHLLDYWIELKKLLLRVEGKQDECYSAQSSLTMATNLAAGDLFNLKLAESN